MMQELSEGFVSLPGGPGTLEEFAEFLTLGQLGMHPYPCGILNIEGYFDHLLKFLDLMAEQKFVRQEHRDMIIVSDKVDALLTAFEQYVPPSVSKWID